MYTKKEKIIVRYLFCLCLVIVFIYNAFLYSEDVGDAWVHPDDETQNETSPPPPPYEIGQIETSPSIPPYEIGLPDTTIAIENETAVYDSLFYEADDLQYFVEENRILLVGNSQVIYHTATIKADSISLDFDRNQALAVGRVIMEDRTELIIGQSAYFDIETETGIVLEGASRFDQGYYYGDEIRKVGDEVYDLDRGRFTTCDALHPHFDIRAWSMRLYQDHVIVGRPIAFYVNEFPVLGLPFAAFSIKSGRASGFLMPEPGYSPREGKKIKDVAYFYVINDYTDILFAMDFYEKIGYNFKTQFLYLDRYRYNGSFNAMYKNRTSNPDVLDDDWSFQYQHFQNLPEKATFNVSLDFASSREVYESEFDVNKKLQESIRSSISYSKPIANNTFVASANYFDFLTKNDKRIVLPKISYSMSSKPIHEFFPAIPDSVRRQDHWWKNFSTNWSIIGIHEGDIKGEDPSFDQIIWKNDHGISQHNAGIRQSISLTHNTTLFNFLRLNNSVNYQDAFHDRDRENNKFVHGYHYGLNSGATFNVYGVQRYNFGPVTAARHIVTPRANFRYSPDFTKNQKFYNFGGVGLSSSRKTMFMDLSLEQKWQFRLTPDSQGQERRLNDLFVLRSSTGYDFEKEKEPWNDLNHSLSINPGAYKIMGINFGLNQNVSTTQKTYDDFNFSSWRMNTSLSLSGDAIYFDYFPLAQNDFVTNNLFRADTTSVAEPQIRTIQDIERLEKPGSWSLTSTFDYYYDRRTKRETQNLNNDLSLKLTQNWTVRYGNYYDITKGTMNKQSFRVERDMHCWRIEFNYTQLTDSWEFSLLLVNLKLSELRLPYRSGS